MKRQIIFGLEGFVMTPQWSFYHNYACVCGAHGLALKDCLLIINWSFHFSCDFSSVSMATTFFNLMVRMYVALLAFGCTSCTMQVRRLWLNCQDIMQQVGNHSNLWCLIKWFAEYVRLYLVRKKVIRKENNC